ncbi:MAG: hypothetical protein RKH07_07850, partial [Gammaproteobacteria bacterium]
HDARVLDRRGRRLAHWIFFCLKPSEQVQDYRPFRHGCANVGALPEGWKRDYKTNNDCQRNGLAANLDTPGV